MRKSSWLLLAVLLLTGCQARDSRIALTSLRDPYFPEEYSLQLDECVYYVAPGGDIFISGVAHQGLGDEQMAIEQLVHLHVFWRPNPGKTHDDPTSADARIDYALLTADGAVHYNGTAFAYVNPPDARGVRRVDLEKANLKLRGGRGDAPDVLGGTRLEGTLYARPDDAGTIDVGQRLRRLADGLDPVGEEQLGE